MESVDCSCKFKLELDGALYFNRVESANFTDPQRTISLSDVTGFRRGHNLSSVEGDLFEDEMLEAFLTTFLYDEDIIEDFFPSVPITILCPPKNIHPQRSEKWKHIRLIGVDKMNAKLWLLRYRTHLRVVIHAANLAHADWEHMTNNIWLQDFPLGSQVPLNEFGKTLHSYLEALRCLRFAPPLTFFDFSKSQVKVVATLPGSYEKSMGHVALKSLLPVASSSPVQIQCSNVGVLDDLWLQEMCESFHCTKNDLQMFYLAENDMENQSFADYFGWADRSPVSPVSLFHARLKQWPSLASHSKLIQRKNVKGSNEWSAEWLFAGSHNLFDFPLTTSSRSAWGKLESSTGIQIRNWELGVLWVRRSPSDPLLPWTPFPEHPKAFTSSERPWIPPSYRSFLNSDETQRQEKVTPETNTVPSFINQQQSVKLLVGMSPEACQTFVTSSATLGKVEGSFFAQLLEKPIPPGGYFIKRSPKHFRRILNFLRDEKLDPAAIPTDPKIVAELLAEATFFRLPSLVGFLGDDSPSSSSIPSPSPSQTSPQTPWGEDRKRSCYMCKVPLENVELCQSCHQLNATKRDATVKLKGFVAIVTGGRVKLGYATVLKLLRCGATVVTTTRFPADAARKYQQEADYSQWEDSLHIYGMDLRHLVSVETFVKYLSENFPTIDILINNAAQTIRRPPAFYRHLLTGEQQPPALPTLVNAHSPLLPHSEDPQRSAIQKSEPEIPLASALTQMTFLPEDVMRDDQLFPPGKLDEDGQQVDLRPENSWTASVEMISPVEMLEVQMVNNVVPFVLVSQLKSLMEGPRHIPRRRFIINVSSAEGQFFGFKNSSHCHTNMAKAALNMLTRTIALDFSQQNIYVNSVDTGWVSKMGPQPSQEKSRRAPLTMEDGAARILDPIFVGLSLPDTPSFGQFFRNFRSCPW